MPVDHQRGMDRTRLVGGVHAVQQNLEALIPTIYQVGMAVAAELDIRPVKGDSLV